MKSIKISAFDFGNSVIKSLKNINFYAYLWSSGLIRIKKLARVYIEIEHSLYKFELRKNTEVVLIGFEQFHCIKGTQFCKTRKKLGKLNSKELEENLKDLLI